MKIQHILVPVDFSDSSLKALQGAEEIAARFGAELHLFHSHPINFIASSPYAPVLPVYYFEDLARAAAKQLHDWRIEHCGEKITVHEHLSEEPPAPAILECAKEIDADMIVMGTRGLSGLKHVLMGSVAERVVQRADCPVLTIKED